MVLLDYQIMGLEVIWICMVISLIVIATRSQAEPLISDGRSQVGSLSSDRMSLAGSKWKTFIRSFVETNIKRLDVDKQLSENENELIGVGAGEQVQRTRTEHDGGEMHYASEMHSGNEISRKKRPIGDEEISPCGHVYLFSSSSSQMASLGPYKLLPPVAWCDSTHPVYDQEFGVNYMSYLVSNIWMVGKTICANSGVIKTGPTEETDPSNIPSTAWYEFTASWFSEPSTKVQCGITPCEHIYISGSQRQIYHLGAFSLQATADWIDSYHPVYKQDAGQNYLSYIITNQWFVGPQGYVPLGGIRSDTTIETDPSRVPTDWFDLDDKSTWRVSSSITVECFFSSYTIANTQCLGGIIPNSQTSNQPLETCLTRCSSRQDCIAIMYKPSLRQCWLYNSCPEQISSSVFDMFFREFHNNCAFLNGGCEHICTNDEYSNDYNCSCHTGYQLTADSHTCNKDVFKDPGDCSSNNGGCAHVCIVTPVGHMCTCNRGYRLHVDGKSCTPDVISIKGDFTDCASLFDAGYISTGIYDIKPVGFTSVITVLCDQQTEGGGWTVFQRRLDGTESFYRNWYNYKKGFGSLYEEFWLGLDVLHSMMESDNEMTLRIELGGFQEEVAFAEYGGFTIADEDDGFKLNIGPSAAASGLSEAMYLHNNLKFYTYDESHGDENLAERFQGGWWYRESAIHKTCVYACLNQRYYNYELSWNPYAITWNNYRYKHHSWKTTAMKFRPSDF